MNYLATKIKKSIIKFLSKNDKFFFDMGYNRQKKILDKFVKPKDLIERSAYQYRCQMKSYPIIIHMAQSFISIFLVLYSMLKNYRHIDVRVINEKKVAVFLREGVTTNIIPNSLQIEFDEIIVSPMFLPIHLDRNDKKFIYHNCIKRYWYMPYFCAKCIIKVGSYSNAINSYNPLGILTHNEYSFASSFLTEYCNFKKVEHINLMHGEKLFDIHDSFVAFNRYYVWDQHYIDLLVELGADEKQFRIELFKGVSINIQACKEYKYDITYYLGNEIEEDLNHIKKNLINTGVPLKRICIRFHPRYSDERQIRRIFDGFEIENPLEVSLELSLSITKYIVSLYSTVLYQAFINDKIIIIDDISNQESYKKLQELKYIMLNKPHFVLSNMIFNN